MSKNPSRNYTIQGHGTTTSTTTTPSTTAKATIKTTDYIVDNRKLDFKRTRRVVRDYLDDRRQPRSGLIADLVVEHLRANRYPDLGVIKFEFGHANILRPDRTEKLLVRLLDEFRDQELGRPAPPSTRRSPASQAPSDNDAPKVSLSSSSSGGSDGRRSSDSGTGGRAAPAPTPAKRPRDASPEPHHRSTYYSFRETEKFSDYHWSRPDGCVSYYRQYHH